MQKLSLWEHELQLAKAIDDLAEAEADGRELDESSHQALLKLANDYALGAAEKRDKIAWFLNECEARAELFRQEKYRLERRLKAMENAAERLRGYVVSVMETFGSKKLDGETSTLSLTKNPDSVQVDGEVPAEFERVIPERREPDKVAIKDALKEGKTVPNCRLVPGKNRLVIR